MHLRHCHHLCIQLQVNYINFRLMKKKKSIKRSDVQWSFLQETSFQCDTCHEKNRPHARSLSLSYLKKDWWAGAPPILLWVWHRLQNIIYEGSRVIFYSRCHTQRRIGGAQARQFFFGNYDDKDLKGHFLVTQLMCFIFRQNAIQLIKQLFYKLLMSMIIYSP